MGILFAGISGIPSELGIGASTTSTIIAFKYPIPDAVVFYISFGGNKSENSAG